MRAAIAIGVVGVTLVAVRPAMAEKLPSGAMGLIVGAVAGTGPDANRLGVGYIDVLSFQAAWQPMDSEQRIGWTMRWSTIFTAVGPKATILRLVVDQALAGDDAPVPIAERTWWREAVDEPDPARSIELHARNMCLINQRAAPVLRALEIAASVDPAAAELWERFQRQRHDGINEFAVALTRKTTRVRYDQTTITDTLCMLAADAYLRLVRDAGWPAERYQDWLTDALLRLFLD